MDAHIALSHAEIVQDLLHIHKDRIRMYTRALQNEKEPELDVRSIVERIIEESIKCQQQLNGMIRDEETNDDGKVYKAWADGKTKQIFSYAGRKAILEACLDDDLAVLNAYSMALSFAHDKNIKELLLAQQQRLQQLHAHIRKYYNAQ
ncbi:MAG TPA: hypothetical protein VJU78_05055 [Chitinophagaceae bacterium]|nr:hypothetical protein [Chitinophagaceae bacterium]